MKVIAFVFNAKTQIIILNLFFSTRYRGLEEELRMAVLPLRAPSLLLQQSKLITTIASGRHALATWQTFLSVR